MKAKKFILTAFVAVLLTSCVSTSYYQVYKATPSDQLENKDNLLVYEDENCKVSYNLWANGGNVGFQFYNKTDSNIYINLEESFFILNDISHHYFKNRVFSTSIGTGKTHSRELEASKAATGVNPSNLIQTNRLSTTNTVGINSTSGISLSIHEERIVCIPSKTARYITEYKINQSFLLECDLYTYPTKGQVRTKTFSKAQSPFVFSNRIAYSIGESDTILKFENEFFVSEISNYPESEMLESVYEEYCGKKSMTMTKHFRHFSGDKFYIRYNKGQDVW